MITEYRKDCGKYLMGNLAPVVYLLPKETTHLKYKIDDHDGKVESIVATQAIRMETVQTKLEVTENTGQRLAFDSTVTATMRENWGETWVVLLNRLKYLDCYIVIEDNSGDQYLQCPEFTSQMTYTYNFTNASNSGHNTEIKFKVSSNNPTLILSQKIYGTERIDYDCAYQDGGITNLWLTPFDYAFIDSSTDGKFTTITCTGGEAIHQVDFNNQSFQFRQQYDGRQYQERLTFSIPFDGYKNYWHYNLVEFMQNRYAITFNTSQGNFIAAGFEFGFIPSYTIETTDSPEEVNTITITLNHVGQNSIFYCSDREPTFIDSTTDIFVPVTQSIKDPVTGRNLAYYHCISKSEACYTLIQMCTETMIPTDRYMCLEGYETTYQNLNIVGTYTKDYDFGFPLIFENYDCSYKDNCELEYIPKTVYTFATKGQSYTTPVLGPCPWEIKNLPSWITCDTMSGLGGISYNVTFTCTMDGTETPVIGTGYIQSFDNVGLIQFICQKEPDWFSPYSHVIDAKRQTVVTNVFESYDDYTVCEIPEGLTYKKVYGTKRLEITVPENTDQSNSRIFKIKLCSPYHEDGYITITQNIIFYQWREVVGEYICQNNNSYKKVRKYKGYSADEINIYTGEERAGELLVTNDPRCSERKTGDGNSYWYEWVDGYTVCHGKDLYEASRKRESYDDGVNWSWTDEYELGNIIEVGHTDCVDQPTTKKYKFIIDESQYQCVGTASYYIECQWYSFDERCWFYDDENNVCQPSSLMRMDNDPNCGGGGTYPGTDARWIVVSDWTECEGGNLYQVMRKQITHDGGITWFNLEVYRLGQVVEFNSDECKDADDSKTYDWRQDDSRYMCDGTTLYAVEFRVYRYTARDDIYFMLQPEETRRGNKIEDNSDLCGYDGGEYRYVEVEGEWLCNEGNKYKKLKQQKSTDGGKTWTDTGLVKFGDLIETDSEDCEGIKVIYDYRLGEDFECSGCTSYYLIHRWESQDGGETWYESDPEVTSMSDVVRLENDAACGCGSTLERWVDAGTTICVKYSLYHVEKKQTSLDGTTWTDTGETRTGSLIEELSEECGYVPGSNTRWIEVTGEFVCEGYTKKKKLKEQVSTDGGTTWTDTGNTTSGDTIMENSPECGYPIYEWKDTNGEICDDGTIVKDPDGTTPSVIPVIEWFEVPGEYICEEY